MAAVSTASRGAAQAAVSGSSSRGRALRRLERRELHRSRSVAAVVALVLTVLALGGLSALLIASALGLAWGASALVIVDALAVPSVGIPVGAAIALVGLVLVVLAVAPGRRARLAVVRDDLAVVVDHRVLASAASHAGAVAGHVAPDRARTTVDRRAVRVELAAPSGYPADTAGASDAVRGMLDRLRTRTPVRVQVAAAREPQRESAVATARGGAR